MVNWLKYAVRSGSAKLASARLRPARLATQGQPIGPGTNKGQPRAAHDPRAAVHQALLSGLVTQVGVREGDRTDFAGPRNTRFAIWPGSVLAKKSPRWVMAAELVETGRLWGSRGGAGEAEMGRKGGISLTEVVLWGARVGRHPCRGRRACPCHVVRLDGGGRQAPRTFPVGPGRARARFSFGGLWWRVTGTTPRRLWAKTGTCSTNLRPFCRGRGVTRSWAATRRCSSSTPLVCQRT